MTTECSAIIIIILIVAGVMARRGKTGLAIAVLPMCITPFFYLISGYLAGFINRWQTTEIYIISRAVIVVAASLLPDHGLFCQQGPQRRGTQKLSRFMRRVYPAAYGGHSGPYPAHSLIETARPSGTKLLCRTAFSITPKMPMMIRILTADPL